MHGKQAKLNKKIDKAAVVDDRKCTKHKAQLVVALKGLYTIFIFSVSIIGLHFISLNANHTLRFKESPS